MVYSRGEGVARALKSTTYPIGMCYKWTREMFGLPAVGDRDGDGDADAVDGWKATTHKHAGDRKPPAGVPVFWSGGSKGHGHAAISLGGGKIRSIDANGFGRVGTVDLGWVEREWGLHYLGWSEDLGGTVIPHDAPLPLAPATSAQRRARDRYLALRKKKGLLRPLALRRGQVNGMAASGVTAQRTASIILDAAPHADVLTLCEVFNVDVAKVLGPDWEVAQDRSSKAKAGVAVAVRKDRGKITEKRIKLGVPAVLRGRRAKDMRSRYIMIATILYDGENARRRWQDTVAAGHAPPKRNWSPWWAVFMANLRLVPAHDIGADFNRGKAAVQRIFWGRVVKMIGIDGFILRMFIPSTVVTVREVGGDHTAKFVTLWP